MTRFPVDLDVAVVDELTGREHGRHEFHAIDDGVQTAFENADQMFAGVALLADGLVVVAAELALADVAVIALQLLLRLKLNAEVRRLLAPLAMLARSIFTGVERAFGAAPQIDAETAVDLVLRLKALGHV